MDIEELIDIAYSIGAELRRIKEDVPPEEYEDVFPMGEAYEALVEARDLIGA